MSLIVKTPQCLQHRHKFLEKATPDLSKNKAFNSVRNMFSTSNTLIFTKPETRADGEF